MTCYITPELAARFHQFGSNTFVQSGGTFHSPEQMAIGHGVFMRAPYSLNAAGSNNRLPVIQLGDGCEINPGMEITAKNQVKLDRNVLIGPHVYISDEVNITAHPTTGAPIPELPLTKHEGGIYIGEGAWIGANAVLLGHVSIGTGSVVKPNSVVLHDVPDFCVVSGSPAAIVQIYEASSGSWVPVSDNEQAKELLCARRRQPLLSICIPTFNRAPHLEHCLESIYSQVGNNELIEVIVSDNASTDATAEIANRFATRYTNMRVVRNTENIGADPNIYRVMNLAQGKFIKLQGDDDFYVDGTLLPLLHVLHSHGDCGVVQIFVRNGDGRIWSDVGMSVYLDITSIYATFITSIVLRREDLERVEEPALFLQSSFNQLYLQYAILEKNPRFCIMNSCMFTYAGISSDEYNFGEVIFRSYQSILQHFVGRGLTPEDIRKEKKRTLFEYAIPWFKHIIATGMLADTTRFEDIYTEHYHDEPYYEEALAIITAHSTSAIERRRCMSLSIDPQTAAAFHHFGEDSFLDISGQFHHPEKISIGSRVSIREYYWLNVIEIDTRPHPKIIIGDGCKCEQGLILSALNRIELGPNVIIEPRVYISDTDHEYRQIGKPVKAQGLIENWGEVFIGEGVRIGAGAVIAGNIRIGQGSIVQPGSVVEQDVPEQCVVSGSPARIIQIYEPALDKWVDVGRKTDRGDTDITAQKRPPLLSICIPTYNRSANLDRCLGAILNQLKEDAPVEVLVSDNASTDDTAEVVQRYATRYPCLKYFRNNVNIGADRNIYHIMRLAKGTFVKMQGDDDYCVEGTLMPLIQVVKDHPECGIIHIHVHNNDRRVYTAKGAQAFLEASTIMSTFISGMILRREDLEKVEQPTMFLDSSFNQMYLQYAILMKNPTFCVVNWSMFYYEGNPPLGYNFGEVVFRSYQSILRYFIGKGLTEDSVRAEKRRSLYHYILPWYRGIIANGYQTNTNQFEEIFSEHYQDEPYYEQVLSEIRSIKAARQSG
ncbi:glycosyltransferase [Paenibacillus taiwanensis]|uniref:glycosyltransferase n=1 Tax=Paenibacillus taiwanensis TaxID=401638 RepID=UPI0003FF7295|nr:glycosyltransferase [Paenibacillus taiwanensis]